MSIWKELALKEHLNDYVAEFNNYFDFTSVSNTSLDSSGEYIVGITGSVVINTIYTIEDDGSGNPEWVLAEADDNATCKGLLAIATTTTTAAEDGGIMLVKGFVRSAGVQGWGVGTELWLGALGSFQTVPPATAGDTIRSIGYVASNTNDKTLYFNPSNTYIEKA